jgi:hypothetical protein
MSTLTERPILQKNPHYTARDTPKDQTEQLHTKYMMTKMSKCNQTWSVTQLVTFILQFRNLANWANFVNAHTYTAYKC